jgi:peptidoglycan/LPS O-acetylase OafA/YrhL
LATGSSKALLGVVLGALSVVVIPAAIAASETSESRTLLQAGFAVPVGLILGGAAIALARSERRRSRATLEGGGGSKLATAARFLGTLGFCIASSGAVALGVYALLRYLESR